MRGPGGRRQFAVARSAPSTPLRGGGFSLLEMLVVVGLVAVIAALVAGMLGGGMERIQLRSAVKEVASNLRFTRAHALATGRPQQFVIDPAARTWQAPRGRGGRIPDRFEIEFTGALEAQPRRDQGAIVFFEDGASTGGRVRLEAGGGTWDIDVAWLTGEVRIHRGER